MVGCCFKCIGCCCCILFLLIVTLAMVVSYLYAIYVPQVPTYEVSKLEVKAFDVRPDLTLNTEIIVTVKASNPNSNIGFVYEQNGLVNVVFNETDVLCSGLPPHFYQGHNNVSMIRVDMAGRSPFGPGLKAAVEENQKSHRPVPLVVMVQMPMRVVVDHIPLREFTVHVNTSMLVDDVAPNKTMTIVSSDTMFHFEFK